MKHFEMAYHTIRYFFMRSCWCIHTILFLFSIIRCCIGSSRPACHFEGGCKVPVSHCFADVYECYWISQRPLDASRGTVKFYANISSNDLEHDVENATYCVLSRFNETWQTVGNCCNMKLRMSSCNLRPVKEGEVFYLFAQLGESQSICYLMIQERPILPWCDVDNSSQMCMAVEDDRIMTMHPDAASYDAFETENDYFFFRTKRDYASGGKPYGTMKYLLRDVKDIQVDGQEKKVVIKGEVVKIENSTMAFRGRISTLLDYLEPICEMWCFYVSSEAYSPNVMCHAPWLMEEYSDDCGRLPVWIIVTIVVVGTVVIALAVLILAGCARSKMKYCHPDAREAVKDIPDNTKEVFKQDNDVENPPSGSEIPDSVQYCIAAKKEPELNTLNVSDYENNALKRKATLSNTDSGIEDLGIMRSISEESEPPASYIMTGGQVIDSGYSASQSSSAASSSASGVVITDYVQCPNHLRFLSDSGTDEYEERMPLDLSFESMEDMDEAAIFLPDFLLSKDNVVSIGCRLTDKSAEAPSKSDEIRAVWLDESSLTMPDNALIPIGENVPFNIPQENPRDKDLIACENHTYVPPGCNCVTSRGNQGNRDEISLTGDLLENHDDVPHYARVSFVLENLHLEGPSHNDADVTPGYVGK